MKYFYRMCTDDFLHLIVEIPKSASSQALLLIKHMDVKDNCVQVTYPEIIKDHKMDRSNAHKALKCLKEANIVKYVVDIDGVKRLMFNPEMVWSTSRDQNFTFAILMYHYASHNDATIHRQAERFNDCPINPVTGEASLDYSLFTNEGEQPTFNPFKKKGNQND